MFKLLKNKYLLFMFFTLACLSMLTGCRVTGDTKEKTNRNYQDEILNSTVAASFAPDGRLWRLIPTKDAVYVDYSYDNGNSFQQPIKINPIPQKINVWPENPPAIIVSHSGRIHLIYYADGQQKATTFFSFSDNNGKTFSKPILVSDHAATNMHYMDKMLVSDDHKTYLFWHDTRQENQKKELGASVLSLYYAMREFPGDEKFINHKVTDGICSCCRTATDLSPDGLPVIMARMVSNDGIRDHALIKLEQDNSWSKPTQVTQDQWQIEACPEHGPALSIDDEGRSHIAWFTLGSKRKGIFYAHTDDFGESVSTAMSLGNSKFLPSHPTVKVVGKLVVLAWKEFDGNQASIIVKKSDDRGESWQKSKKIISTDGQSGHPELIAKGEKIFLSWTSKHLGHQLIQVNQ
jgi:hypothetical protein